MYTCINNKQSEIKFALLNIQGLKSKRINKLNTPELKLIFENNDIVCLTETGGTDDMDFTVNGFIHYHVNRTEFNKNTTRSSDGIIIYLRDIYAN